MIPRTIRIVHAILVEQIFVVVQRQRTVVFWQAILFPVLFLKGLILGRIPVLDRRLIQVGLDKWAQA